MSCSKLPRGLRKFIRKEKSRIRATTADRADAERLIRELVLRYHGGAKRATLE